MADFISTGLGTAGVPNKADLSTLIAGENLAENVMQIVQKPSALPTNTYTKDVSTALEASSIAKNQSGTLYQSFGIIDKSAPSGLYYILFLDSATLTADGAVTHLKSPEVINHVTGTDSTFDTGEYVFGIAAANGITICLSSTMVTKTISGAYLFFTTLVK